MFCKHCGAEIKDDNARFCSKCGGIVAEDMQPELVTSVAPRTTGNPLNIIWIFLALVLIGGVVVLAWGPIQLENVKKNQGTCLSNQHQLTISIIMYYQEHDERLPLPSEWINAVDIPVEDLFNCPSDRHRGTSKTPDYGMNAFLFSTDQITSKKVGLSLGKIEDPSKVLIFTDINGPTDTIGDDLTNPFPDSFTVNGFGGTRRNGDLRHRFRNMHRAVVAFIDGHTESMTSDEIGENTVRYSLPVGSEQ